MNAHHSFDDVESMYDKYAEFYDLCAENGREDLPIYLELADKRSLVVDVGCGTGRLTTPLAEAGHRVIAVDLSPGMLAACERKTSSALRDRLTIKRHDFCTHPLEAQADLAIVSWFTFNYVLSVQGQLAMLRNIWMSLRPGGIIAMDLFYPKCLKVGKEVWEERDVVIQREPPLIRNDRRVMEGPVEIRTQEYLFNTEQFTFRSKRIYVTPPEVEILLRQAGFSPDWLSFDFGETRFDFPVSSSVRSSYLVVAHREEAC
jgi:SAM-dependent methyltransferase